MTVAYWKEIDVIVRNPDGEGTFSTRANVVDVAIAESFPPHVMIRYAVAGPGVDWGEEDNGDCEETSELIELVETVTNPDGTQAATVGLKKSV